jgi:hypothetical protein
MMDYRRLTPASRENNFGGAPGIVSVEIAVDVSCVLMRVIETDPACEFAG